MGPRMGPGVGTGIAPPPTHPATLPRVHPPPTRPGVTVMAGSVQRPEGAVGLKSVDQLTLSAEISGSRGITEVYNLRIAGITNDH